jgi:rare lipoprotein A
VVAGALVIADPLYVLPSAAMSAPAALEHADVAVAVTTPLPPAEARVSVLPVRLVAEPWVPGQPDLAERTAERPPPPVARPPADGVFQRGTASWYGPGFAGNRTANGEVYDPSGLTAAHRSLAFGTIVRVTNLRNGRSVVVRINDRGPFVGGRIIDLSAGAVVGMVTSNRVVRRLS